MQMLGRMIGHAEAFRTFRSREEIAPRLKRFLEAPEDVEAAIAAACGDDAFDCELLSRIVAVNAAWGTKTGLGHAGGNGRGAGRERGWQSGLDRGGGGSYKKKKQER